MLPHRSQVAHVPGGSSGWGGSTSSTSTNSKSQNGHGASSMSGRTSWWYLSRPPRMDLVGTERRGTGQNNGAFALVIGPFGITGIMLDRAWSPLPRCASLCLHRRAVWCAISSTGKV